MIHLVRVPMKVSDLARWAGERGWIRQGRGAEFDHGRALHHLLGEVFGPRALQPFRLLLPPRSNTGNLFGYSSQDAAALREAAGLYAWPEHLEVVNAVQISSKPMPSNWQAGRRLGIDVRVRPVRRMRRAAATRKGMLVGARPGTEIDAFWLQGLRNPDNHYQREAVYLEWLAERLGAAADLDREASRMKSFRRVRAVRGAVGSEGPDAVIHGTLTVRDPDLFATLLRRGIGRHRAYGYGMLLLRPPRQGAPVR